MQDILHPAKNLRCQSASLMQGRIEHSSVATTTKVYVHAIQSADEIAANLIEEKLDLAEKPRKTEGG